MKFIQGMVAALLLLPGGAAGVWAAEYRDAGDGISWKDDRNAREPWAMEVVRIERGRSDLSFLPTLGRGTRIGLNTLTGQVKAVPRELGEPLVAINGDFFQTEDESFPGDPRGLFISRGELVSAPSARDCFWIQRDGTPRVGVVRSGLQLIWPDGGTTPLALNEDPDDGQAVLFTSAAGSEAADARGFRLPLERSGDGAWMPLWVGQTNVARVAPADAANAPGVTLVLPTRLRTRAQELKAGGTVQIVVRTTPDLTGVQSAIGGGPALVRGGKALSVHAPKSDDRHPRSALGWNARHYFLVVVDGRQEDYSDGMTLPELAEYLVGLGCDEAMNLDGGGSTELWLRGRILNRPCYGHERRTATTLVVLRSAPASKPVHP